MDLFRIGRILILFLWIPISSIAANWCLRVGIPTGNNTGLDWDNAWTNVNSVKWGVSGLVAGDTLYVAGGFYTNHLTPTVSGGTGNPITIRRARDTNAACSSITGWSPAFDFLPILDFVFINGGKSNLTFEGEIPYEGLMITQSVTTGSAYCMDIRGGGSWINVRNCQLVACGYVDVDTGTAEPRCWKQDGLGPSTSNHLQRCVLRNACTLISTGHDTGMIVEDCILANTLIFTGSALHPNIWYTTSTTNVIFRNNLVTNWTEEGIMMGSIGFPCVNWDIYGNVFQTTNIGSTRVLSSRNDTNGPIRFYNNTIVTNKFGIIVETTSPPAAWTADCVSSNNIYFGQGNVDFGNTNSDYNLSDHYIRGSHSWSNAVIANVIPDLTTFQISPIIGSDYPRNKGVDLGSYYSPDANGKSRGYDGGWDIGAYEFPLVRDVTILGKAKFLGKATIR